MLRIRLGQARLAQVKGEPARSAAEIAPLIEPLRKIGTTARPVLAQALVARGDALLAERRSGEAITVLTEAVQLREQLLWDESWELAEARALLGEALGSRDPRGRELLTGALAVLEAQVGADHPLSQRARRVLAL